MQWTYQEWESVAENRSLFFSPPCPPPSCSSLWFFSALRVQKEADRESWVSGWWAAFVAAPSSCLAFVPCFVQIEKCYVFLHHFSLPGEWDSYALSLISAQDSLPYHFYHWWTNRNSPVSDSPPNLPQLLPKADDLQGQSQREMDGCSGLISFSQSLDDVIWL